MEGIFITLEGPEGGGKSTQAEELAQYLRTKGYEVVYTREPGGTKIADRIREIILSPDEEDLSEWAEFLLFLASRAQHVEKLISPALRRGAVVICDRFDDATRAYQGYGRGIKQSTIEKLNQYVTGGLCPDLTLLLDVPVQEGLIKAIGTSKQQSSSAQGDRMEQAEITFHQRVREGYLALARQYPERIKVIEPGKTIAEVQGLIRKYVDAVLKTRRK